MGDIRFTATNLRILKEFIDAPTAQYSGAELARLTRLPSGTLYPILIRFEQEGILQSYWEEIDPKEAGRPRRRLYQVTSRGGQRAREIFGELMPNPTVAPVFNPAG